MEFSDLLEKDLKCFPFGLSNIMYMHKVVLCENLNIALEYGVSLVNQHRNYSTMGLLYLLVLSTLLKLAKKT